MPAEVAWKSCCHRLVTTGGVLSSVVKVSFFTAELFTPSWSTSHR